jgi:hypothetical protein
VEPGEDDYPHAQPDQVDRLGGDVRLDDHVADDRRPEDGDTT